MVVMLRLLFVSPVGLVVYLALRVGWINLG
jgi:hypothetical protein